MEQTDVRQAVPGLGGDILAVLDPLPGAGRAPAWGRTSASAGADASDGASGDGSPAVAEVASDPEGVTGPRRVPPACGSAIEQVEAAGWMLQSVELGGLDDDGLEDVVTAARRVRSLTDGLTLKAVALLESIRAGSSREALVRGAKLSGRQAKRVRDAAHQVGEMPNVARLLDAGDLTLDNLFALGDAAKQCGASTVDGSPELLESAAVCDAGSFRRTAREFAQSHDPSRGETLLERQRSDRRAHMFVNAEGMGVVQAETDPVSFGLLDEAITERRDYLWRKDGGGDGKPDAERNNAQRTMDALFELCTGLDARTHEPLGESDGPGVRPFPPRQIIVVAAGVIDGTEPNGSCEVLGVGPVPPTLLDRVSGDDRIAGALFAGEGQPLWLGRTRRMANVPQHLAIAVRDRGCVLCHAPMQRCHLHHLQEWDADRGATDVENLAALCNSCHRRLHSSNSRLVRKEDGRGVVTWATRPRGRAESSGGGDRVGDGQGDDATAGAGPSPASAPSPSGCDGRGEGAGGGGSGRGGGDPGWGVA